MIDYISREDAKLHIFEYGVRHRDNGSIASACENLERQMNSIPAADVRPVVLCRDCEYWKQWDNTTHYLCTYVAGAKFIRNAEDFCSRGEKREES